MNRLISKRYFLTLFLILNCAVPWILEWGAKNFALSIKINGMATAIHESLCSFLVFVLLKNVLDEKRWGRLYRWSLFSLAIGDLMFGVASYIIRLPPPRGYLPLVHEIPYSFFALLSATALFLRATENSSRRERQMLAIGIGIIGTLYFIVSYQLILNPFLHALPRRPLVIYGTAFTYAIGQSIFLGSLFVASLRTLSLTEFGMWFLWILLIGSDFALRFLDIGNHLPMLSFFEYGWEFSLSAVFAVVSYQYFYEKNDKLFSSDLAPMNSIRAITGSLTLISLFAIVAVTWLTFSLLGVATANTAASYAIIFAIVWSVSNCGSILVSQRVRTLYQHLRGRENSVEDVPKGLSWEVREIFDLLRGKNLEVQAERDRILKITSTVAHNIRSPLLALRTVLPILSNSLGQDCGCNSVIVPHVDTLNFAMRTIETTAGDLLTERRRLTHSEPVGNSVRGAVSIAGLKFPTKTFEIEMDDSLVGPRIEGLSSTLINLLSNAAEATSDEAPIRVVVKNIAKNYKISILDSGHGIGDDLMTDLLSGKSVTTKSNGNGLGVTSAISWAKLHGYDFEIDSKLGGGTSVSITLPESAS